MLWPLARSTPLVRVSVIPLAGDPRESWVGWMLRGIAREAGLIEGTLDHPHALACRDLLRDAEIEPQRTFHRRTMSRALQVQHVLTVFAERLFLAALILAVVHLIIGVAARRWPGVESWTQALELLLAGCGVAFPAFAASIHGFLGTGDFAGIAIRSASIEPDLAEIDIRLGRLDPLNTTTVGELAIEATALMEGEPPVGNSRTQRPDGHAAAVVYQRYWERQLAPAQQCRLVMADIQRGERVLDVACGTGLVTFPAADAARPKGFVLAADISDEMVRVVTLEAERRGLLHVRRRPGCPRLQSIRCGHPGRGAP
ncbi:MAG: methyltransferase domain-containing protein [Gemmatimonadales bacterium]